MRAALTLGTAWTLPLLAGTYLVSSEVLYWDMYAPASVVKAREKVESLAALEGVLFGDYGRRHVFRCYASGIQGYKSRQSEVEWAARKVIALTPEPVARNDWVALSALSQLANICYQQRKLNQSKDYY
jgi:hypothetical protein